MSATNAAAAGPVATLAQGLRALRDNAEGPDGVELEILTRLDADTIADALSGRELPTLGVTVALVDAWGGDVEAWALYWSQINEIAAQAQAQAQAQAEAGTAPKVQSEGSRRAPEEPAVPPVAAASVVPVQQEPARATEQPEPGQASDADKPEQPAVSTGAPEPAEAPAAKTEAVTESEADSGKKPEPKPTPAGQPPKTPKTPNTPLPRSKEQPRRTPVIIAVLVVLAAAAGGIFAYVTVRGDDKTTNSAKTGATGPVTPSPSSAAGSHTPPGRPTSSAAVAPASSSTPEMTSAATTTTSYPAGYELGSYQNVQLPSGYSVDFSSDPSHPTFGTGSGTETLGFQTAGAPSAAATTTDGFDTGTPSTVSGRFLAGQAVVFDADEPGTFERCLNDTRYQSDVDLAQLSVGAQFCVHTPGGRLVLVRVDRMPQAADANPYAVIDLTVWQGR